ncbi:hypothetical protein Bca52824_038951 [Brassica carinata]|uniref:Endonuclease/exonuclease/phosphatase domain-containing protein n=1 Tax=Brassica carinata TaxID=52824 RepID=A0A8X7RQL3_BRACI|nr:hypothetical protein Bca52824_038951 [Brassica carinata]
MQNQQKGSSYQDIVKNQRINTEGTKSYRERFSSTESKEKAYLPSVTQPFQARVDRHGKPFGERVSTKQTRAPPPDTSLHMEHKSSERAREHGTSVNGPLHISPQHVKSREARPQRKVNNRLSLPQKEMMQWREKYPKETHEEEVNSPAIQQITPLRAPLAIEEVQDQLHTPINQPPTREAIMDDLQEVTRQYVNCPDPIESAARRQRVLHGDAHGQMEETVDRILTAAVARYQAMFPTPPPQERAIDITTPQLLADSGPMRSSGGEISYRRGTTLRRTNRRRFKPARLRSTVSSPLALQGASSKKRNFARAQGSPNRRSPVNVTAIENPQQEASQRNVAGISFHATFVYGEPDHSKRIAVWNTLSDLHPNANEAWFLTGDFNEIVDNNEKSGGPERSEGSFCAFRSFLSKLDLFDTKHSGNYLSWRGVRGTHVVQCRLDRSMCNSDWVELFPSCRSQYLNFEGSDHRPLLSFLDTKKKRGKRIFRYDRSPA